MSSPGNEAGASTCLTQYANLSREGIGQSGVFVPSPEMLQGQRQALMAVHSQRLFGTVCVPSLGWLLQTRLGCFGETLRRKGMYMVGGANTGPQKLRAPFSAKSMDKCGCTWGCRSRKRSLVSPHGKRGPLPGNSKEPLTPQHGCHWHHSTSNVL